MLSEILKWSSVMHDSTFSMQGSGVSYSKHLAGQENERYTKAQSSHVSQVQMFCDSESTQLACYRCNKMLDYNKKSRFIPRVTENMTNNTCS